MTHIGKIIHEFRLRNEMSRKELAENICSEQYIYLIEKGERTPSVEMSALFSFKLGVDLFEYYPYLSAHNPIVVYEIVKKIYEMRRTMNYEELNRITEEALNFQDFHKIPWCYDIELNKLSYEVFVKQEWKEAIEDINKILKDFELTSETDRHYINLAVLLSTCYQMGGDLKKAELSTLAAEKVLTNKMDNRNYKQEITAVNLNLMTVYYYQGNYNEAIKIGLRQIQIHSQMDSFELSHYTLFYLSFAYFENGMEEEAFTWFERGLSRINFSDKYLDAYYISQFETFQQMIKSERTKKEQAQDFLVKYMKSSIPED